MSIFPTSNGVPYLPDGYCLTDPPPRPWPAWIRIAIFILCYVSLQALYARCGGTGVERLFLESMGSQPAAALIDMLHPTLNARAIGARITAPGAGVSTSATVVKARTSTFFCLPLLPPSRCPGVNGESALASA